MTPREQLQAAWSRQSARIDALSVRERIFIFLTLAVLLMGLLDSLLISPLSVEQSKQLAGLRKLETELQSLRQQFQLASQQHGPNSPQAVLQRELDEERQHQQAMQQAIASVGPASQAQTGATGRAPLNEVLGKLLQAHPRLRLARLATLEDLPAGVRPPPGAWTLQAVDLRVQGDYLELTRYLTHLQQQLPGLRWGDLKLSAEGEAPGHALLQLQLVLVKPQ